MRPGYGLSRVWERWVWYVRRARVRTRKAMAVSKGIPGRIRDYFENHPDMHSVKDVAEAIGVVRATAGKHLLKMVEAGELVRRPQDTSGGKRFLYRPAESMKKGGE
jgi:response regulator of citrate/malate metabolism